MSNLQLFSSTDILLSLFPKIEDQLVRLASKFAHSIESSAEKKGNRSTLNTGAVKALFNKFPHDYSSYSKCVNDFVSIAQNSPESGVCVLLKVIPNYENNDVFLKIKSKINVYDNYQPFIDLFLYQFFADCTAQILSSNPKINTYNELISLGYKMSEKYLNPLEETLRMNIIRQYSVVFSILSVNYLGEIINRFLEGCDNYDYGLFVVLHRFLRLNISSNVSLNRIHEFLLKYIEHFEKNRRDRRVLDLSAMSLSCIISQLSSDGCSEISDALQKVYNISYKMASEKETDVSYLVLCSVIIIRLQSLFKSDFKTFLIQKCLKKHDRTVKIEATLLSFLTIIRGPVASRSNLYWEWGEYNSSEFPGIEISHIMFPDEDQKQPVSFTGLFFEHLVKAMPIEKFPEIVGQILVNFASRDFETFMLYTVPKFIQELGVDRALLSLHACLSTIISPKYHFAEWAQENSFNSSIRIEQSIHVLFVQLKPLLLQFFPKLVPKSLCIEGFCFELSESKLLPEFSLPFTTSPFPETTKRRIAESTKMMSKALQEWEVTDKCVGEALTNDFATYESITNDEQFQIKILAFLPKIVNSSDLTANDRIHMLLSVILSSSRAVSFFALKVVNQLFVVHEDMRLIIYNGLVCYLAKLQDPHHVFILLQLLVQLLDMSLPPNDDIEKIMAFINDIQGLSLYMLCFPVAEIRDLLLQLLLKVQKLAISYSIDTFLISILNDFGNTISSRARTLAYSMFYGKINPSIPFETLISFSDAACSRWDLIFQYYICELMRALQRPSCAFILKNANKIIKPIIIQQTPDFSSLNEYNMVFYQNMCIVLFHTCPATSEQKNSVLRQQFIHDISTVEYKNPIVFQADDEALQKFFLEQLNPMSQVLIQILNYITNPVNSSPKIIDNVISIWRHMNWTLLSEVLPFLNQFIHEHPNISTNISILLPISQIFKLCTMNTQFHLSVACVEESKMAFISFLKCAELFFVEKRMNGTRRFDNSDEMSFSELKKYSNLCINYCNIIEQFISALCPLRAKTHDGPLRAPIFNEWLESGSWSLESRRGTLAYLMNWSKLHDQEDSILVSIGDAASNAICVYVRGGSLFDTTNRMHFELEHLLISLEKSNNPTLRHILASHYYEMLPAFITYSFNSPPELAPLFFNAICMQFTRQDFDTRRAIFDDLSSRFSTRVKSITTAMASFSGVVRKMAKTQQASESEYTILTPEDVTINIDFLQKSGSLVLLAVLYLSHSDFSIRCSAFRFLQRTGPVIHHLLHQSDPKSTAKLVRRLSAFAPSFFSNYMTISIEIVLKVAELCSQFFPELTDTLVQEAFKNLTTSTKGSFMDASNKTILLDIAAVFMRNQTLTDDDAKGSYPGFFIVYTPFSLLSSLLDILPSIEVSSMKSYLGLWNGLAATEENVDFIVTFLVEASSDILNEQSVKRVLVHLSNRHASKIVSAVSQQLSFANWWHLTMQHRIDGACPPPSCSFQRFTTLLMTLIELIQTQFQLITQYLHTIIIFSLLFFDTQPTLISELLLVLLWNFPGCPDSLTQVFLPPCSLLWPIEKSIKWPPQFEKSIASSIVSLQQSGKEPMAVSTLVSQFVFFFKKCGLSEVVKEWGIESFKWCTYCGDLLIASKAAIIFSEILEPFDSSILDTVSKSFSTVASCVNDIDRRMYLSSILQIYERAIDKFSDNVRNQIIFFNKLSLLHPLMSIPDEDHLCRTTLSVLTKYIMSYSAKHDEIMGLFDKISPLIGHVKQQNNLLALLIAICKCEKDKEDTKIPVYTLIVMLPLLYRGLAAVHNIPPYSSHINNEEEITNVIESVLLVSECLCFNENIISHISQLVEPDQCQANEFTMGLCKLLCTNHSECIVSIAPVLTKTLISSSDVFLPAFLTVIGYIFESQPTIEILSSFTQIVSFATKNSLPQSAFLLERYLSYIILIPPNPNVVSPQNIISSETVSKVSWEELFDCCLNPTPIADTDLTNNFYMIPLDASSWTNQIIIKLRNALSLTTISPFTQIRQSFNEAKSKSVNRNNVLVDVDRNALLFLNFRGFLRDSD